MKNYQITSASGQTQIQIKSSLSQLDLHQSLIDMGMSDFSILLIRDISQIDNDLKEVIKKIRKYTMGFLEAKGSVDQFEFLETISDLVTHKSHLEQEWNNHPSNQ